MAAQSDVNTLGSYSLISEIIDNSLPKWRWVVVDIYRAAKRRGKNPPQATDTDVNIVVLVYT